jgi:hypothetical protein
VRALSTPFEVAGFALVAFGIGIRWFWAGIVAAGVGLVVVGFLLSLPESPTVVERRDE